MVFGSSELNMPGGEDMTPTQIAESRFMTAQEKIDLLTKLKAKVTGAAPNDEHFGFTPEEIDEAIAKVHRKAEEGEGIRLGVPMGRQSNA